MKSQWAIVIAVVAVIGVLAITGNLGQLRAIGDGVADDDDSIKFEETTASVTLTLDAFSGTHGEQGAETEVYPTWTVTKNGNKIVNDVVANSTTSVNLDDVVNGYLTGASYYGDPKSNFEIDDTTPIMEVDAYDVVATTDLVIVAYQDDGTTALTADDGTNNTADYAGGAIGAGENYQYVVKLKNNVADKTFRLGAILTYYCGGEADDFEMTGTYDGSNAALKAVEWTEVSVPSGLLGDSFTHYDDTNGSTSCNFKRAYVPTTGYVDLYEWDWIKVDTNFDADDTTQPRFYKGFTL